RSVPRQSRAGRRLTDSRADRSTWQSGPRCAIINAGVSNALARRLGGIAVHAGGLRHVEPHGAACRSRDARPARLGLWAKRAGGAGWRMGMVLEPDSRSR